MEELPNTPPPSECILPESPPASETKVCRACGEEKPIESFRIVNGKGGRRDCNCRSCYNARQLVYYYRKRTLAMEAYVAQLCQARDMGKAALVAELMLDHFDGVQGFQEAFSRYMEHVGEADPGSYRAFRPIHALGNLLFLLDGIGSIHAPGDRIKRAGRGETTGLRPSFYRRRKGVPPQEDLAVIRAMRESTAFQKRKPPRKGRRSTAAKAS